MNAEAPSTAAAATWPQRWQRFSAAVVRSFHAYANWLVGISWRRFIVLATLLIVAMAILHDLPPFTWTITEHTEPRVRIVRQPRLPAPPAPPAKPEEVQKTPAPPAPVPAPAPPTTQRPGVHIDIPKDMKEGEATGLDISIGKDGVRITAKTDRPAAAASAAQAAASEAARAADAAASAAESVHISVPPGASAEEVREAIAEARRDMEDAVREARRDAEEAARDAEQARRDAAQAIEDITQDLQGPSQRTTRIGIGDFLMQFTLLWVAASAIIKFTYKGRMQAEVKAAQATETAEAESLKRQVVEARMAAMQVGTVDGGVGRAVALYRGGAQGQRSQLMARECAANLQPLRKYRHILQRPLQTPSLQAAHHIGPQLHACTHLGECGGALIQPHLPPRARCTQGGCQTANAAPRDQQLFSHPPIVPRAADARPCRARLGISAFLRFVVLAFGPVRSPPAAGAARTARCHPPGSSPLRSACRCAA